MTVAEYGDFVWSCEWKVPEGGNSGMFFKVLEQGDESWWTGLEMQVFDNFSAPAHILAAGSLYDMYPPTETGIPTAPYRDATLTDSLGKPGGFNHAIIVVQGKHVEGWLNGMKVLAFDIGTADWETRRNASNYYRIHPEHGQAAIGHLLLQGHGTHVWYRNLKVRPLVAGQPGPYGPFVTTRISTRRQTKLQTPRASRFLQAGMGYDALGIISSFPK